MSKKKAKMPSASTESRRDWGRVKKEVFCLPSYNVYNCDASYSVSVPIVVMV